MSLLEHKSVANGIQKFMNPINLVALRQASNSTRRAYNAPKYPTLVGVPGKFGARQLYKWERPVGDRSKQIKRNIYNNILNISKRKGYKTTYNQWSFAGSGIKPLMAALPDHIKIKYMKEIERMHIAEALAKFYSKRAFNNSNEIIQVTNRNRISKFNQMTKTGTNSRNPTQYGFQAYRQKHLIPIVAEGTVHVPHARKRQIQG